MNIFIEHRKNEAMTIMQMHKDRVPVCIFIQHFQLSFLYIINCVHKLVFWKHFCEITSFNKLWKQVIIERMSGSSIPLLDRRKFLLPRDISVAQFIWIIRKRIKLESSKSIFIFVGKLLPQCRFWLAWIFSTV